MADNISDVTDATFLIEVIQSAVPVLVDFWAPWCQPCKSIAPVIEDLANEFSGKLKVVKINVDVSPKIAAEYDVKGIPNLVFFKGGQVVEGMVGVVPKDTLVNLINKIV